ncbi:MAG: hypothetical protein KDJ52_29405 [Anaerolineae bacterium]|nr:hypothetical protein [Anaerolineae bacterium]
MHASEIEAASTHKTNPMVETSTLWLDAQESGEIVYFLFQSPARLERYNLTTETWLSSITLSDTPTAFTVDADGLYIAFSRRVSHFQLDGTSETHLRNTDTDIKSLHTIGAYLYINYSSYPYGKLVSVDKISGTFIDSKSYLYDVLNGSSVAPSIGKLFARTSGISPSDIVQVILNTDGTLGSSTDSPYHGNYPNATKTYVFPGDGRVVDSAGIIYNASDLTYSNSFAGSVNDITFYEDLPIVLRGNKLIAFS